MAYKKAVAKNERALDDYKSRRAKFVRLLGGKCVLCGTTDFLEFHHKDPEQKSFNIAKYWSYEYERVLAEVMKCELRCGPCHRIAHEPAHGTERRWKRGCRCLTCTTAMRVRWARWKKRNV